MEFLKQLFFFYVFFFFFTVKEDCRPPFIPRASLSSPSRSLFLQLLLCPSLLLSNPLSFPFFHPSCPPHTLSSCRRRQAQTDHFKALPSPCNNSWHVCCCPALTGSCGRHGNRTHSPVSAVCGEHICGSFLLLSTCLAKAAKEVKRFIFT